MSMDSNKCSHCGYGDGKICETCYRIGTMMAEGTLGHEIEMIKQSLVEIKNLLKDKQIYKKPRGESFGTI